MISFANFCKLTFLATVALNLSTDAAEAPKRIDVSKLSKRVDDVVVPLPNEVFGASNNLGGELEGIRPQRQGEQLHRTPAHRSAPGHCVPMDLSRCRQKTHPR